MGLLVALADCYFVDVGTEQMRKTVKIFVAAIAVLGIATAQAEVWQARYGVAETFDFKLYNADGTLDVDEADGGAEVSLSCNEGAETTATNDFVDEGTSYSIALTATEMQCERIAVVVAATTTEVFFIQTSANASAMTPSYEVNVGTVTDGAFVAADFASDFITAAKVAADVSTEFSAANFTVNTTSISGDSAVADRLEAMLDGTCGAYAELGVLRGVGCTAQAYTAGTPSLTLDASAAFGDNALTGATVIICGSTQGYCEAATIDSNVGSTDVATLTAALPVALTGTITYTIYGTASSSGSVSIAAGGITAASIATGAIDADALAADAGTELGTATWATTTRALTIFDEDSTTMDLNATAVGSLTTVTNILTGLRDTVIEDQGSVTWGCAMAVLLAGVAGDLDVTGSSGIFEEPSGAETRITYTITSGDRAVTITCPTY